MGVVVDEDDVLGATLFRTGGGGGTSPVSIDDRTEFKKLIVEVCESVAIIRARQEQVGIYESSSCLGCRAGHIELTSPAMQI